MRRVLLALLGPWDPRVLSVLRVPPVLLAQWDRLVPVALPARQAPQESLGRPGPPVSPVQPVRWEPLVRRVQLALSDQLEAKDRPAQPVRTQRACGPSLTLTAVWQEDEVYPRLAQDRGTQVQVQITSSHLTETSRNAPTQRSLRVGRTIPVSSK